MYHIGIDLGGTNIVAGVVTESGRVVSRASRKTRLPRPSDAIVSDIIAAAKEAASFAGAALSEIGSAGIGSPGSVNLSTGVVEYSNNLGFTNVPLQSILSETLGIPAFIANDANAFAYGEFIAGAGRGTRDFVAITLGTGVGGGVIINEKLYTGYNDSAGELGHTILVAGGEPCTCGLHGCVEAYTSATALIRQTKAAMQNNPESKLHSIARTIDDVDGRTAWEAAQLGDETAKNVIDTYIDYLSAALTNYINIFQPEKLAVGGGVANQKEKLLTPLRERVSQMIYTRNAAKNTEILYAELGDDAGIVGAAMLHLLGDA